MLKDYVVCDECINGEWGFYSIRVPADCSSNRFEICDSFDTYEEAVDYVKYLRNPVEYFRQDD